MGIRTQGIILLAQLILIAGLFTCQGEKGVRQLAHEKYILFDKNKITGIYITDSNANKVALKKQDGQWLLPAYHQLPVNRGLLDELMEKLAAAKPGWPLAQSESAA